MLNQLNGPYGLSVDDDQNIYIADHYGARIVEWERNALSGRIVAGGNGEGNRMDQLYYPSDVVIDKTTDTLIICDSMNRRVVRWPRLGGQLGQTVVSNISCWGLAMDDKRSLYIADYRAQEVRRWAVGDTSGEVVAGGNGWGLSLTQLDSPRYIFVDRYYSLYVSDAHNSRVMKWAKDTKQGVVVAGGRGQGNATTQMIISLGVLVDPWGSVYVADHNNQRIMRWQLGAKEGNVVVGGNGQGKQANQFQYPQGIAFDRHGNLYVVDQNNHRVQRFTLKT